MAQDGRGEARAGGRGRGTGFVAWWTVLVLVTLGFAGAQLVTAPAASAALNDPISCGRVYAIDQSGETRRLYSVDTATGAMTTNNAFTVASGGLTNALAVDVDHNRFWFAEQEGGQTTTVIHRFNPLTGADLAVPMTLTNAPSTSGGLVMGAYSPATQIYYFGLVVDDGITRTLWVYGFNTLTNTPVSGVVARVSLGSGGNGDFAFDQSGRLYIVSDGVLLAVNEPLPTTGTANGALLTTTTIADPPGGQNHSMAFGSDGYMYLGSLVGDGRVVYQVNPSTGTVVGSEQLVPLGNTVSDFASCASPNSITLRKTLPDGRLATGDQFNLAITGGGLSLGNTGTTTGAETGLQDQEAGEVAGPVLGLAGTQYTITETAAGTTSFADYATTYTCVDRISGSTVASGSTTSGTVTMPDSASQGADVVCTFSNTVLRPDISVTKSADPQDGTTVNAGQQVTYTLTFRNAGSGSGAVSYDDVVAGVLDDATVTAQPTSSSSALTASAISGSRFSVTGSLAAGQSATVTYTVTVKSDGERGDNLLANFVVPPGQDPPATCAAGDPLCTQHPVPEIGVTKSVDPVDGSSVAAGQELTYSLTFTNTGRGPGQVAFDDVVVGVLDDATVTAQPTASDAALTASAISAGRFSVTGPLAAGQTVTVSYTVTVDPDGERGDDLLANFVVPPAADPPAECVDGDPLCTQNPVSQVTVVKSVDPADGSTVTPGQQLTYTLTFTNGGRGAGAVSYDDVVAGVLDDATLTAQPAASDSALTATAVTGGRFSVTGTVAAGQTVTVSYSVTVKADGERGDDLLANFVVPPGADPPAECVGGDPLCTEHPVPLVVVTKSVDPADGSAVTAGQQLTYTLSFSNTGQASGAVAFDDVVAGVLDDATVTSQPTASSSALTASAVSGGRFTVTGSLAAGQTVTVTYSVTVKADGHRGDNLLANFVVPPGADPPAECVGGDPLCTENPVPLVGVTKSVDPADGSTVTAGQQLTYTLFFSNTGQASGSVAYDDVIGGVLDDATVVSQPTASSGALTASAISGGRFTVTGSLAAGQTVTVSYSVTVKADGERGDNLLANFVVPPDQDPPAECAEDDPLCTENPVPQVAVTKSVDPASGTTVTAGQELTYTLTFTNAGRGAGQVAFDDVVAGVLDDATLTAQPAASDSVLTVSAVSGGRFGVTGTLAAGQTVTVSYSVMVKAAGERGDDLLANFVVPPGADPPAECAEDDPLCTQNPVSQVSVVKFVDPADGSTVTTGEELTYTLTFTNAGRGAGAVAYDDVVAGVLDDAIVTAEPAASNGALTATAVSGGRFSVTGTLTAGQTVTVSYTVTVKADGERGDNLLANVVVPPGVDPPAQCAQDDPLCTENPVPEVGVAKSVDPADGSTVAAGQDVTYTLTFTNAGQGAGQVAYDDVISGVLDDATVTDAPTASGDALTASSITDGRFSVTGTLGAGDTVTVRYAVRVKADGERGDDLLANVVVLPGAEPPADCAEGDPLCTENPVSRPTSPASPVSSLPFTGAATFALLALALTAMLAGAGLYAARGRIRREGGRAA